MLIGLNMRKLLVTGKIHLSVIRFRGEDARNAVTFNDQFYECGVPTHLNPIIYFLDGRTHVRLFLLPHPEWNDEMAGTVACKSCSLVSCLNSKLSC